MIPSFNKYMGRSFRLLVPLFVVISFLSASSKDLQPKGKKITIRGYLVDVSCVNDRATELSDLGPSHTKKCLLMPACERSGYAVMDAENHVYRFDTRGNALAKNFIVSTDKEKDWQIIVSGNLTGDQLAVSKLHLRK